jgi:hypothetical protein
MRFVGDFSKHSRHRRRSSSSVGFEIERCCTTRVRLLAGCRPTLGGDQRTHETETNAPIGKRMFDASICRLEMHVGTLKCAFPKVDCAVEP